MHSVEWLYKLTKIANITKVYGVGAGAKNPDCLNTSFLSPYWWRSAWWRSLVVDRPTAFYIVLCLSTPYRFDLRWTPPFDVVDVQSLECRYLFVLWIFETEWNGEPIAIWRRERGFTLPAVSRILFDSRSPPLFIDWRRYIHYTVKNSYTHCQVHTEWVSEWVNELRHSADALCPLTLFVLLTPYGLSVLLFCVWWREAALWTSFLLSPSRGSSIITLSALIYRGRGRVSLLVILLWLYTVQLLLCICPLFVYIDVVRLFMC